MDFKDWGKIDSLALEILHDADIYEIRRSGYRRNSAPTEEEFEDIDIDDLDALIEDQSILAQVLSLREAGYAAEHIALDLDLELWFVNKMLRYLSTVKLSEPALQETIINLRLKGHTVGQIARLLGISIEEVKKYIPKRKPRKFVSKKTVKRKKSRRAVRNRYSSEQKQRVLDLCANTKMTYVEIAKVTGVNRITVNRWCKQFLKQQRRQQGTPEQKKLAKKLFNQGLSNAEVARRVGLSPRTIGTWRRKLEQQRRGYR